MMQDGHFWSRARTIFEDEFNKVIAYKNTLSISLGNFDSPGGK